MIMKTGQQWHCTNPACHCEVVVQSGGEIDGANPRCVCGFPMKKRYTAPRFTYLEFLEADEPVTARESAHEA